jgi:hypothetical protein
MRIGKVIISSLLLLIITFPSLAFMSLFLYGQGVKYENPLSFLTMLPALVFSIMFGFILEPRKLRHALILGLIWEILSALILVPLELISRSHATPDMIRTPERNLFVPLLIFMGPLITCGLLNLGKSKKPSQSGPDKL